MRKLLVLATALVLVLVTGAALAADDNQRSFAPVQDGFVASVAPSNAWVPNRLIVQFTVEGAQLSSLPGPAEKSAGPLTRTGLASLDLALDAVSAKGLRRAYPEVQNKTAASALGIDRWYILELESGSDVPAAARRLAQDPNLASALPDLYAFPAAVPNDPNHADNWGHNNTIQLPGLDWGGTYSHTLSTTVGTNGFDSNAHAAWNGTQGYGNASVVIAILDSGVDVGHPDLLQVTGYDYGDNDSNPDDDSADPGHGTACAGVAAAIADNALGVAGIAGGSSIMPLKVANSAGDMSFSAITNAIYFAADNDADIISLSLGAATTAYAPTDNAITYAYNMGVVILAATGNENASQISYPAYNPQVIGVGAASPCGERKRSSSSSADVNPGINTDPNGYTCDGERWWGSNYGSTTQDHQGAVDIIAPTILPTTDIQGTGGYDVGDYSSFFNGTSCATPYAAGVCALIKAANPSFTPNQVRAQLVGTAFDIESVESGLGWDRYTGYGMVDAAAAMGEVVPPGAIAAFAADDTTGCAPFTVNFTDMSVGPIATWKWTFGDGLFVYGENPSHTYFNPGIYDVTLEVTSPDGNDSTTKFGYITVGETPTVAFTASVLFPEFVYVGESIDFTDQSTGNPTSWAWDFGDGSTSTLQNPSHVYNTQSAFNISLVVTNDCGTDALTTPNMVMALNPPAPVAAFSLSPNTGCAPLEVAFTDESTGTINSWLWDFGDGATDTTASPTHTYTVAGSYDVSLTVANESGPNTATSVGAVVVDGPPAASFTASAAAIAPGESVSFTDTSTGAATSWSWTFGDGGSSIEQNPVHQFDVPGVYDVTLIATNACGSDTALVIGAVTVEALAIPVAAFSNTPEAGCAPLEVTFTDASLNGVTEWHWDFGDGAQDTLQNPVHTYVAPGSFDVRLIVSAAGGIDTLIVPGAVVVSAPVAAAFTVSDTLGVVPLAVTFTDASTGSPTSWHWDFGDAGTDTVASPVHTYLTAGFFDVTLIVSNSCSSDTLVMAALVHATDPSGVDDSMPVAFGLGRNYPNPFNPSTTIVFNLEKPGRTRLEIFDVSGRLVASLVDADKSAGRHEITWRPADLASGVYFSRLSSGNQVNTGRVTLLK
jgi:PKD repeat protein/subtilisin family serine protease